MGKRGPQPMHYENVPARLPPGTMARLLKTLKEREPIAQFIREAVARELKRRERNLAID